MNKWLIDKKLLKQLDFSLLLTALLISTFSCINIYSAMNSTGDGFSYLKVQILYVLLGLSAAYLLLLFDYNLISNFSYVMYWAGVGLLVYTDFFAAATKGAKSWVKILGINVEPAEVVKIALILLIAKKIDSMEGKVNNFKNLMTIVFYTAIPVAFIIKQPNLGLAVICLCIVFGMLFISGLQLRIIFGTIAAFIVACALVWNLHLLKPYQTSRITSFINPQSSHQDSTYQVDAAKLAIGSGQVLGKGFLKGTQVSGGFIPEDQTDMVFSVVGEEWGLVGALTLLILYSILLFKMLIIAKNSKDILGKLICVGYFASLTFSIFQNIGMNIGLTPVAGITLPFMSYGGSSALTNYATLGLVLNVGMRRKKINF